jgi:hypothetical protein
LIDKRYGLITGRFDGKIKLLDGGRQRSRVQCVAAANGDFFDVRIITLDPPGPAVVGQKVYGESGPRLLRLRLRFEYVKIDTAISRIKGSAAIWHSCS